MNSVCEIYNRSVQRYFCRRANSTAVQDSAGRSEFKKCVELLESQEFSLQNEFDMQ